MKGSKRGKMKAKTLYGDPAGALKEKMKKMIEKYRNLLYNYCVVLF